MRIVAIAFVSFATLASCTSSLQQTCQDYATAWCNQHYNCATGVTLSNLQEQYGQTAADCSVTYAGISHCSTTTEIVPCGIGTSYDSAAAEACVQTYASESCAVTSDPNFVLADQPNCAVTDICH